MPPDEYGEVESQDELPRPASSDADKMGVIEALLFVSPEPLSAGMLSEVTGFDPGAVREMLNRLTDSYAARDGGLVVREVAGGFGFYASPFAAPYIARLIKSQVNPRLTRAALETISIVAYLQPVSRGVVAEIRGVQSEGVMRTLEDRGMVKAVGRGGPPGYAALYGTTGKFLERFGLKSLDDLPGLEEFAPDEATIEKIKRSLSWELEEDMSAVAGTAAREDTEDTGAGGAGVEEGGGGADPRRPGDPEREEGIPG
ncbi:MAG TPA: SMC-Scp complex subunit ScpB [Candidatus Anoxymicrobiaceae bacterium]